MMAKSATAAPSVLVAFAFGGRVGQCPEHPGRPPGFAVRGQDHPVTGVDHGAGQEPDAQAGPLAVVQGGGDSGQEGGPVTFPGPGAAFAGVAFPAAHAAPLAPSACHWEHTNPGPMSPWTRVQRSSENITHVPHRTPGLVAGAYPASSLVSLPVADSFARRCLVDRVD